MNYAARMARLGTETAFEVLARAQALEAQGKSVVHLEIGEPDFDTPAHIRKAAIAAIESGWTHYGPSAGLKDVREGIATAVEKSRGIYVDPAEVVITPGGKPILFFSMLALLDEGDEAIYPNPGFPIYESVIEFLGAKAIPIQLHESKNWAFDIDELASLITPRTKLLVLNSPHNPTGPIAHLASIHLCAASPTLQWLEHQWDESPLFDSLVGGVGSPLVDGAFVVPAAPGLGATLDRELAAAHPWRPLPPTANLDPRLG